MNMKNVNILPFWSSSSWPSQFPNARIVLKEEVMKTSGEHATLVGLLKHVAETRNKRIYTTKKPWIQRWLFHFAMYLFYILQPVVIWSDMG